MNTPLPRALTSVLLLVLSCVPLGAQPVERAEVEALRARVRELELQLQGLMSRLDRPARGEGRPENREGPAPAPAVSPHAPAASEAVRLRTLVHVDARTFLAGDGRDSLLLRRARLVAEGTVAPRLRYYLASDFGGSAVSLLDASLAFDVASGLQLKAGKFKSPLGMEILHPAQAVTFTERTLVSGLLPNRDVGVALAATGAEGRWQGTVGVFNGGVDGTHTGNQDFDGEREWVGRMVTTPWRGSSVAAARGLTLGIGGSHGRRRTSEGRPLGYRTPGLENYFLYRGTVVADGAAWRLSPQLDYRLGPLGVFGEYVVSASRLSPGNGAATRSVRHHAWQLTTGYVLTGEESTSTGLVPRAPFDPALGTWGAFEVVGRWSEASLDAAAFPHLAAPETSGTGARSLALGLNWHLSGAVRAMFDYYFSRFEAWGGAPTVPGVVRRPDESVFVSRLQLAF